MEISDHMGISGVAHDRICRACAFSAVVAVSVATPALGFKATPTVARGYSSSFDIDRPWNPRRAYGHSSSKIGGAPSAPGAKIAEINNGARPLFAVISIADQRVSVYNNDGLVARSAISTGMPGHPTPKGVFTIIGRERYHRSNIYSNAPMPFMQRITWSGIAMHLGVVPGHPASHGCIRLPAGFAAKLWGLTKIGERVVISPQEVTPIEFTHPLLPAPKMRVQAEAYQAAPDAPQATLAAVQQPLINPHQYAEQLRAKAVAKTAAAVKTVKELSAAVRVAQQEAALAAAELKAAEAAHSSAQAKVEAAAKAFLVAAASGKPQGSMLVAELKATNGNVFGRAKPGRLYKVDERAAAIAKMNVEAALADAAAKLEAAKTASAAKAADLADAVRRLNDATVASNAAANAEKEALRQTSPLSMLVSKKDQRIYVRQGLAPVFDVLASVRDPERPLGSHLYIATAVEGDGTTLKWSVVSIPTRFAEERGERQKETASVEEQAGAPPKLHESPLSAADALERIEIAQDVRDRIAEHLWIGASLIISDQPLSGETGAVGTDLTVKVR
ncbi:MAG: L,D-transpeptidase [Beijerinckiaceae bacterium]|nr:L,D-transpeptidase [Beijerinckiaceae bacterium]